MRVEQLLNCQISSWYPQFAGVASKTKLIDLTPKFVDYLTADGIYLPEGSAALPKRVESGDPEDSDDYQEWSEEDEEPEQASLSASQEFPELVSQINAAIAELGGAVLPKLNWSCPKDAAWLTTGNSLKCTNAEEVLLLLKASDRVAHDICHALEECEGSQGSPVRYTLALRKWLHLRPGREFRCFVRGHDLIGVSQRHVGEHFPGLDAQRDALLEQILEFFEEHIENRFPDPDFTFDIYITSNGNVRLVDFNPIGSTTSPLLFTWDALGYSAEPGPAAATSGQQGPSEGTSWSSEGNGAHSSKASNGSQSASAEAALPASGAVAGVMGSHRSSSALVRGEERFAATTALDAPGGSGVASVEQEAAFLRGSGGDDAGLGAASSEEERDDEAVGAAVGSAGIQFRVVTEHNRVQPNMLTFGVPFDLVDNSEGGAYDELLQRLQQEQLH